MAFRQSFGSRWRGLAGSIQPSPAELLETDHLTGHAGPGDIPIQTEAQATILGRGNSHFQRAPPQRRFVHSSNPASQAIFAGKASARKTAFITSKGKGEPPNPAPKWRRRAMLSLGRVEK